MNLWSWNAFLMSSLFIFAASVAYFKDSLKKSYIKKNTHTKCHNIQNWILVYSKTADQEEWLFNTKNVAVTLFKWGWICIVMCHSDLEKKIRFSDQIDPASEALRNWQV